MPSAICHPTVKTGFSAVEGSWNTMATSRPRICRSLEALTLMTLFPLITTAPELIAVSGRSPEDGFGRNGLAGSRLADDRHDFAGIDLQADVLDRIDVAGVGGESDLQVVNVQDRAGAVACRC